MTTKEFLQVAPKLININKLPVAKKGSHNPMLGFATIGSTNRQNTILWRKYGTLVNIVILYTADEINALLKDHGITEFVAIETKSGQFCRLTEPKYLKQ